MMTAALAPYRVMLHEEPGDKFQLAFDCEAEDHDHAAEQATNAYPGCVIISTQLDPDEVNPNVARRRACLRDAAAAKETMVQALWQHNALLLWQWFLSFPLISELHILLSVEYEDGDSAWSFEVAALKAGDDPYELDKAMTDISQFIRGNLEYDWAKVWFDDADEQLIVSRDALEAAIQCPLGHPMAGEYLKANEVQRHHIDAIRSGKCGTPF